MPKKRFWKHLFTVLRKKKPSTTSDLRLSSPDEPHNMHIISLLSLPNEVLLMIAESLEPKDLFRLLVTNRRFACLLTSLLHKYALQDTRDGTPALHWAAKQGHVELVRLLLQMGVDVNLKDPKHRGWTALHLAARWHHEPVVRLLLEMKADGSITDRFEMTPLHRAVDGTPNEATIRLLLESGVNVDAQDFMGNAAIHRVVYHLNSDSDLSAVLQLLLDFRANIAIKNIRGETIFHEVVKAPHIQLMRMLLKNGARDIINEADDRGRTALHHAVAASGAASEIVFELLLQSGPQINLQDLEGLTATHIAIARGHYHFARRLVAQGADLTIRDRNGKTARDLAKELNLTIYEDGDIQVRSLIIRDDGSIDLGSQL